ncbi:hypothetical protein V501_07193 [Pseudogymnoascus sp. VKM F-4519 (FW-2642)]|nr:hypothetical protein V501_07193 [Pseudogymnoascus sp. VKM F-4519 (FW-2642)]
MSHLTYTSYEGYGQRSKKNLCITLPTPLLFYFLYSHHPGGWDRETDKIEREINAQIERAFENVEHNLKTAGAKGWQDVYFIRSYHLPINDEAMEAMVRCLKKYCPDHQPAWTALGINRLAFDDMRVEIEVEAHVPGERI